MATVAAIASTSRTVLAWFDYIHHLAIGQTALTGYTPPDKAFPNIKRSGFIRFAAQGVAKITVTTNANKDPGLQSQFAPDVMKVHYGQAT